MGETPWCSLCPLLFERRCLTAKASRIMMPGIKVEELYECSLVNRIASTAHCNGRLLHDGLQLQKGGGVFVRGMIIWIMRMQPTRGGRQTTDAWLGGIMRRGGGPSHLHTWWPPHAGIHHGGYGLVGVEPFETPVRHLFLRRNFPLRGRRKISGRHALRVARQDHICSNSSTHSMISLPGCHCGRCQDMNAFHPLNRSSCKLNQDFEDADHYLQSVE